MSTATKSDWQPGTSVLWTGRAMSGVFILFMLGASVFPKFFKPQVTEPIMTELGWPIKFTLLIGIIELAETILYAIPRTSILGAIFLTGLLGGAMASQLRIESPLFSHVLFGVYLGFLMWGGLWLRSRELRALFPVITK